LHFSNTECLHVPKINYQTNEHVLLYQTLPNNHVFYNKPIYKKPNCILPTNSKHSYHIIVNFSHTIQILNWLNACTTRPTGREDVWTLKWNMNRSFWKLKYCIQTDLNLILNLIMKVCYLFIKLLFISMIWIIWKSMIKMFW